MKSQQSTQITNSSTVTVIGLGAMGQALGTALLGAGHPTSVWNRTERKAEELVAAGAVAAATPGQAVAASDLIIVCLLDQRAAGAVLEAAGDALRGRVVVNLTNGTPAESREVAAQVADQGGAYLAGGIMAVPTMIAGPEALVLYSGPEDTLQAAESVLAAFGRVVHVGTGPGDAALYDQALLSGMYGMFAGAGHGLAMVAAGGGDADVFMSSLLMPWLGATLPLVPENANAAGEVAEEFNAAMQVVALENILSTSVSLGLAEVRAGHLQAALEGMRQAAAMRASP